MAIAAYAALLSLTHVLDNVQNPARRHRLHLDTKRIQSLQDKVQFLLEFLEVHSQRRSEEIEDLARQITVVADEAEDVLDGHVVDQLRDGYSQDGSHHHMAALSSFCQDIDKVIGKINSIMGELMMVKEQWTNLQEQKSIASLPTRSSEVLPSVGKNNTMVGFDDHLIRVMDELTADELALKILPIVGMGGIGKTTLARNVFDDPYIIHHFDKRIWLTISQEYSSREILMGLLSDRKDQVSDETLAELGQPLHQMLFGRRYLIVMDDMWSTGAWNDLKLFFPNISNGSRVLVTTRLTDVAVSLGSHNYYKVDFLDENKSWNLLCQKTFGLEGCPYPELEEIGKHIAKKCNGLPLAIVVVAGLLANSNVRQDYWEMVARNINSFSNLEDGKRCLKILYLSYNNLPIHLKPCFLSTRVFPEDFQIPVSHLIKLWVVEGFLKPTPNKSLEDVAKQHLRDLIDRNLIWIRSSTSRGKLDTCGIHDLLRDLCLRESEKEYFIHVPKVQEIAFHNLRSWLTSDDPLCFLCHSEFIVQMIDLSEVHVASQSTSFASRPVCNDCKKRYPNLTRLRLVRLKAFNEGDREFLHPTILRCLSVNYFNNLEFMSPSAVRLLWNLQTLYLNTIWSDGEIVLPPEIWEMPQLRHLIVLERAVLADPIVTQDSIVMHNLQTLSYIRNFRFTMDVIEGVPNLKKLKICYRGEDRSTDWSYYCLHNVARLPKIESLFLEAESFLSLKNITFPTSLKKLSLKHCSIPWEEITIIGSLPNLEVFELQINAATGPEWRPVEGQFLRLKVLKILNSDLVRWRAENMHFPNLNRLVLWDVKFLEEIPSGVGDIPTLERIELDYCSDSVVNSAKQILEEQQSFGNETIQVYVDRKQVSVS